MAGQRRATTPPPALSIWLGTGAVALGIGAALTTGTAVASADTSQTGGRRVHRSPAAPRPDRRRSALPHAAWRRLGHIEPPRRRRT